MAWITPKTDWTSQDGIDFNDLNRIEGNTAFIATNPSEDDLQLAPDGGDVLIGNNLIVSGRVDFEDGVKTSNEYILSHVSTGETNASGVVLLSHSFNPNSIVGVAATSLSDNIDRAVTKVQSTNSGIKVTIEQAISGVDITAVIFYKT